MKNLLFLLIFFVIAVTEVNAQAFKVIVNEANATESISKEELSNIFLKKKTKWDDGSSINPIDLTAQSTTRIIFSQQIHARTVGAIRSYWQQAAFSGAGTPPLERSADAEVIKFIKANAGSVGYISAATETDGVKVLTVKY